MNTGVCCCSSALESVQAEKWLKAGTHYPCSRAVFTGVILDTRQHGPSRSADAIVNGVTTIFYLQDECPKRHPCSRAVFTAREHG